MMDRLAENARMSPRRSRVLILILVVTCSVLGLYIVSPLFFGKSLEHSAVSYQTHFFNGDLQYLYDHSTSYERELLGLTPKQIERLKKEFFLPRMAGITMIETGTTTVDSLSGVGTSTCKIRFRDGREANWSTSGAITDDGIRYRFTDFIRSVWILSYMNENRYDSDRKALAMGFRIGCRRDIPLLQNIGLEGLTGMSPGQKLITWDRVRQKSDTIFKVVFPDL